MENENEKQEEGKTEIPKSDAGEGDKSASTPLIDGANAAAERLEKATEASREENNRTEELAHRDALGGETSAGSTKIVEEKKEETPKEYKDRIMAGEQEEGDPGDEEDGEK